MHGAGIYRQRYGLDPRSASRARPRCRTLVDAFVAEQEAKFGGEPGERAGADYELLQLFDRLSLYFCMRDVEAARRPSCRATGSSRVAPWHVRMSPVSVRDGAGRASRCSAA